MALTYGFYNSSKGDRVYNAEEFSSFLDGIVYDGVYSAVGQKFNVAAVSGKMQVTVDTGRAWFDHTWTYNSTKIVLSVPAADTVYTRIDAVVLEVNKTNRRNYIKIVKGTPSANPQKPAMTKTSTVIQHPLAYITVGKNVTKIEKANIQYVVGTGECPIASALALAGIPSSNKKVGQVLATNSKESGAIGWYDIDKLPYDKWYLCDGITESDVLAAYKFIKRGAEATALKNMNTAYSYPLAKSGNAIWNNANGFRLEPWSSLHNQQLANNNPTSIIVKFAAAGTNGAIIVSGGFPDPCNRRALYIRTPLPSNQVGAQFGYENGTSAAARFIRVAPTSVYAPAGILGISFSSNTGAAMWFNGASLSLTAPSSTAAVINYVNEMKMIGMRADTPKNTQFDNLNNWKWASVNIQYIAFYKASLNTTQHGQIYRQINSDAAA